MQRIFPKRNDYGDASFDELVPELARFGIMTIGKFKSLMTKHRRELLRMDRDPLALFEIRMFSEDYGRAHVMDTVRRQYWFAYPGLVRVAIEMEFGEDAAVHAKEAALQHE
jgi:hypothetical protein